VLPNKGCCAGNVPPSFSVVYHGLPFYVLFVSLKDWFVTEHSGFV